MKGLKMANCNRIDSRWQITVRYETTTDLSGRTLFDFDHDEVLTNHTFGQTFNYVRGFFNTRGGNKPYDEQHCSFENVNNSWDLFNLGNDSDSVHVDEEYFVNTYQGWYNNWLEEYSRWMDTTSSEHDPYTSFREMLLDKGVTLFTVYKNQTGLGRVLSETLYLKRVS